MPSNDVTELLQKWRAGDDAAIDHLAPLVYHELRRLAHQYLQRERQDHTLQTTALVHEAYLTLVDQKRAHFHDRLHFFAVSGRIMRRILVDYARAHQREKRGGGAEILVLNEAIDKPEQRSVELLSLDDALTELEKLNPQQSRVVELRFFGGLSIQETADTLRVSKATVNRNWVAARAWLIRELKR